MPTKRQTFPWAQLPRETLRELVGIADGIYAAEKKAAQGVRHISPADVVRARMRFSNLHVNLGDESIQFDSSEVEDFFDRLGGRFDSYGMSYNAGGYSPFPVLTFQIDSRDSKIHASVAHPDSRVVDRVMATIRDAAADNPVQPEPERPRVFIGHGGSGEWQKTERWLRTLNIEVKAYETLPHSGRTIERVLTEALEWANFALLVMTAEDERSDSTMQARQNVVHELGLFQGRLGWDQALVLLEDGTSEFSNIAGTNQFRFPAGSIDAKHGDIIVALRERFGSL